MNDVIKPYTLTFPSFAHYRGGSVTYDENRAPVWSSEWRKISSAVNCLKALVAQTRYSGETAVQTARRITGKPARTRKQAYVNVIEWFRQNPIVLDVNS